MATLTKSTGTVTLSGAVEKVIFPAVYGWVWVKNMSDSDMFAGLSDGVSAGADGVMRIPAGDAGRIQTDGQDSVYLMGTGNALVVAQNYADCPFKLAAKGGEAPDLSEYAKTADIRNDNLLINPDFKINQRGETDFHVFYGQDMPLPKSQKYTVDRWRIMDGDVNISNGKFVLSGIIIQVLENSIGSNFKATVSVESGTATASYDDSTKTFTIEGNNAVLNWAKLEYGSIATPFIPPDTATELLKCKRYFETKNIAVKGLSPNDTWISGYIFDVPKRVTPSISLTSSLGTPDTLSNYTGADSEIKITGYPTVSVDRINSSSCSKALGYISYSYRYTADAEIY